MTAQEAYDIFRLRNQYSGNMIRECNQFIEDLILDKIEEEKRESEDKV